MLVSPFLSRTHLALLLTVCLPVLHASLSFDYWLCVCVYTWNRAGQAFFGGKKDHRWALSNLCTSAFVPIQFFHTHKKKTPAWTAYTQYLSFYFPSVMIPSKCPHACTHRTHTYSLPSRVSLKHTLARSCAHIRGTARALTNSHRHTEALCSRTQRVWTPVEIGACQRNDARESGSCQV